MQLKRKLDFRCSRVKSLSFHPYRHWLLCGLHSGAIYVLDFRLDVVTDVYIEHEGAVRAVDFHQTQPLFVSGSDDALIKVWNYNLRRCLFTLCGHTDFVRTAFFHPEQPWIVSASDDCTVRLWNWQNRSCMASLPGHNHFVMCAKFVPKEFKIISCSLDKTIRVWDISSINDQGTTEVELDDYFDYPEVTVLHDEEAHTKGVNWVDCSEEGNLVASGGDDSCVCLWKLRSGNLMKLMTFCFHTHNVCSVMFFKDFILSASEDRSVAICTTEGNQAICRSKFSRPSDRYWMLAKDERRGIIAVAHDSGCELYAPKRQRPLTYVKGNNLYLVREGFFEICDLRSNISEKIPFSGNDSNATHLVVGNNDDILVALENQAALFHKSGRRYEFGAGCSLASSVDQIAPGKFVGLTCDTNELATGQNQQIKIIKTPFKIYRLFRSVSGTVLCSSEKTMYMYHISKQMVVASVSAAGIRHVVWDKKMERAAFFSRNLIIVVNNKLIPIKTISDQGSCIKSVVFDEMRNGLYYTTSFCLKYCDLVTSDVNTINCTSSVTYLVKAVGDKLWTVDRNANVATLNLNKNSVVAFKEKLQQKAYREAIQLLSQTEVTGQALVSYLYKRDYAEVALQIEKDPITRFYLAIECGLISVAKETAAEIDDPNIWTKLAHAAVFAGDIQIALLASTKAGNDNLAAFLSLITGNTASIGHLMDVSSDANFRMEYALHMIDPRQRIRILVDEGQLTLAYLTAKSNHIDDLAEVIAGSLEPEVLERLSSVKQSSPPDMSPIAAFTDNWPMLQQDESIFSRVLRDPARANYELDHEVDLAEAGDAWNDEEPMPEKQKVSSEAYGEEEDEENLPGWDEDEDLGVDVAAILKEKASSRKSTYITPAAHPPIENQWLNNENEVTYLVAAGEFDKALALLQEQICISNPHPLKPFMLSLWSSVRLARPAWKVPSVSFSLNDLSSTEYNIPALPQFVGAMEAKIKQGYQLFVEAKFIQAYEVFQSVLYLAILTAAQDNDEKMFIRNSFISQACKYARALAVQLQIKKEEPKSTRALSLALYFTHFDLLRPHKVLALSQAMTKSYKTKNFRTAAGLGKRLLELDPPKTKADQASAIIFEGESKEDTTQIDYNEFNPFELCAVSLTPMYKGSTTPIYCPHCQSPAMPKYRDSLCPICQLCPLGVEGLGLWSSE